MDLYFSGVSGRTTTEILRCAQNDKPWRGCAIIVNVAVVVVLLGCTGVARADRVDDLLVQLGSTNEEERAEAADSLARTGGARVEEKFNMMLTSASPEQRQVAMVGLLEVNDSDENLEKVRACLKDGDSNVRWSAVFALQNSGRAEVIPWLVDAQKSDKSDSVREAATTALGKLRSSIQWTRSLSDAENRAKQL